MTEVLHSSCSSSPSSISTPTHGTLFQSHQPFKIRQVEEEEGVVSEVIVDDGTGKEVTERENRDRNSNQLSLLALLVTLFRKSFLMACKAGSDGELCSSSDVNGGGGGMEIGWPTDVQHVAHVTFDRFNGFRGLPVEFEPEVPRRAPSASATVFGVSTESMQLSFDPRGNSVPTILLQMQSRLYAQGGLQAEGIFRITAGNSQEEYVRDQLNRGVVPEGIDVHCLAGLIKAWFRELPRGILDPLSPEEVMQCQSQEHCVALVRLLPPTEAALLDWAINLMADVVLEEHLNKMNARNIAMVFAPNMTQMADPLTALMYAVQVMNFLKTLIERTLQEREDCVIEPPRISHLEPTDEDGNQSPSQLCLDDAAESNVVTEHVFVVEEPDSDSAVEDPDSHDPDSDTASNSNQVDNISDEEFISYSTSTEESDGSGSCETPNRVYIFSNIREASPVNAQKTSFEENTQRSNAGQSSDSNQAKTAAKISGQQIAGQAVVNDSKCKGLSNLSRINSITERIEAWR